MWVGRDVVGNWNGFCEGIRSDSDVDKALSVAASVSLVFSCSVVSCTLHSQGLSKLLNCLEGWYISSSSITCH